MDVRIDAQGGLCMMELCKSSCRGE